MHSLEVPFFLDSHSYLMVSSVVGFYSLRFFENFTPRKDDTTMTKVRYNLGWAWPPPVFLATQDKLTLLVIALNGSFAVISICL